MKNGVSSRVCLPRVGGPQFPHQVDDAVQFRCLEGQQPFVVPERERRHRVGPDILVLAGRHAVFGEHAATLLVGQQIPLIGPHERVDADVGARLLAGQKRRDVALVEFGRPVQRDAAPHRRRRAAQRRGPAEVLVGGLQRFDAFGVRPDHEVGVGPQSGDVVETAHHDAVFFALLEEGGGFVDDGLAVFAELPGADREHREHQVSHGGVQSVVVQAGHDDYRATEVSTAWIVLVTARPAAPMHAGTPIPSR